MILQPDYTSYRRDYQLKIPFDLEPMIPSDDPVRLLNRVDGRISTDAAGGGAQYNNDELNAIIDIARTDPDPEVRKQAYYDVQDFILEHTICIGLYVDPGYNACRAGLVGETYTNDGYLFVNSLRPEA